MTVVMSGSERATCKPLLAEYDSATYGPLFAVSDEGNAGPIVLDAALSSAKAAAGASSPVRLGVILDGERITSAGEVPIGPPEYATLSAAAAERLLLTTNIGTRVNVRLTRQLPEFPALEKSAEAVIAAFHPFIDTPDRRPRPLTIRLQLDPGADRTELTALVGKLDEARKKEEIGHTDTHRLSVLVSFNEEIATDAQLQQIEEVIASAANIGVPEVAIDGPQLPYARQRWGAQGLLNVLSIPASNRLLKFASARGVRLTPRYQVDVESAARTIWTGLEAARVNGFDAGKYGLLPLTLEEQAQVMEPITRWTTGWTAIPAFYVDTPLVTTTEVFDVAQCEVAARRWLNAARGAGATTVLFDAPDRVNPRKLMHGSDSPDGVLTPDQIQRLHDYGALLGVNILWSGGITVPQAFDLARRRVFGIFSTSSTAAKIAVTAQFERDPRLPAEHEPTEFGVRRMHAIIQGGFLSSRMGELDAGLARELDTSTASLVASGGEAAKSRAALEKLNELLLRGWQQLLTRTADNADSQAANRGGCKLRPVPADSVRVFRGRKKADTQRDLFVRRLGEVFMPITVQMQRLYGLTAYLPAILPESKESTIPDEVALVFYRTQACYREAKRCIGGRAYSELHELAFDMSASSSGFPKLLAADEITPDQPYHLFERSIDWQAGYTRLFVGTRKTNAGSDAFLAGVAKVARHVQTDPHSLDAAIFSATGNWVVWWDHSRGPTTSTVQYLDGVADLVHASVARCLRVPPSLLEPYAGLSLNAQADFLNLQFSRL